jgi:hypothetical protein
LAAAAAAAATAAAAAAGTAATQASLLSDLGTENVTSLQHLYDCVYSPEGAYNCVFRQQIQSVCCTHAKDIQRGREIHQQIMQVTDHDGQSTPQDRERIFKLLQPFVELAGAQLSRLCELHFRELRAWLAVAWENGGSISSGQIREAKLVITEQGIGRSLNTDDRDGSTVDDDWSEQESLDSMGHTSGGFGIATDSLINHVVRVDPNMAFLSKLGEVGFKEQQQQQQQQEKTKELNACNKPVSSEPWGVGGFLQTMFPQVCTLINHWYTVCTLINHCYTVYID